jgi:hypothetical protein
MVNVGSKEGLLDDQTADIFDTSEAQPRFYVGFLKVEALRGSDRSRRIVETSRIDDHRDLIPEQSSEPVFRIEREKDVLLRYQVDEVLEL